MLPLKDYYFKINGSTTSTGTGASGTKNLNENGLHDVAAYKFAMVNVKTGTPIEITDTIEMEAVLVSENIGKIYKYVGETNNRFTQNNYYEVAEVE